MASITKRPDGRWRARYRDTNGKEHAKHFDRKVDGQRWLNEVTAAVITGQYVDPRSGRVTFRAYYDLWSSRQVWEGTTRLAMDLAVRSASFADLQLAELHRSELEQWVKQMTSAGLAPGTIRTRFMNVRSVLRAAVRDRLILRDPGEGVALPRVRRAEAAMTLPTGRDVGALLQAADGWLVPMVGLAAFAGLRLGEAAAVQVGDVDYLRRRLVVRRQVQRLPGGLVEVRAPKYGSERVVFLADQLLDMLSQQVRDLPSAAPTSWMFVAQNGQPPHQNTVGHHWRRTCARAGVSGFTLHDLRHFYASGLIAAGCDVVTVQRALGHAKATTTLNTYAHLWPTAEDRTRAAAAQLLDFVTGSADSLRTERHL